MNAKKQILDSINNHLEEYMELVQTMYDNPEIGNEEFETVKLLPQKSRLFDYFRLYCSHRLFSRT